MAYEDNPILAFLQQHPELLQYEGDVTQQVNPVLQKQAEVAGEYRNTPMPSPTHALGFDRFGSIIAPTSPLEYLNAAIRQRMGGDQERQLLQQQIANLLRTQQGAQAALSAGMGDQEAQRRQQEQQGSEGVGVAPEMMGIPSAAEGGPEEAPGGSAVPAGARRTVVPRVNPPRPQGWGPWQQGMPNQFGGGGPGSF